MSVFVKLVSAKYGTILSYLLTYTSAGSWHLFSALISDVARVSSVLRIRHRCSSNDDLGRSLHEAFVANDEVRFRLTQSVTSRTRCPPGHARLLI